MNKLVSLLVLLGVAAVALADVHTADSPDYGDQSSATLMIKGWEALEERKYEDAVKVTERCTELYEGKAREMQAGLEAKPSADVANDYWALNDVGTCYFIQGEALTELRQYDAALAAYKVVMDELYYSQAWDTKGWFWSPADAAAPKIQMLEARQNNDF
jgi:tetratricopeptide (TPR) repeat protein